MKTHHRIITGDSRSMAEVGDLCAELELVERMRTGPAYDRLYLTPLGIEASNIFGLDIQTKRGRLNLSFKYLEQ
ncbi:MAG TPA: hypothetical protein P5068_08715 [Sedimentisphaerales bacterium]|nr:hypothetical protein [Sedimentisphaerales bacterium]HRV47830.1 hypothetical protein [Sedimentisphaerales bacterium]